MCHDLDLLRVADLVLRPVRIIGHELLHFRCYFIHAVYRVVVDRKIEIVIVFYKFPFLGRKIRKGLLPYLFFRHISLLIR